MNPGLVEKIISRSKSLGRKKVLAGFDGFIDTIVKPIVSSGDDPSRADYFKTIDDFGAFISAHAHRSSSVELDVIERRRGGNMPNFVHALGTLGADVTGIGMLDNENGAVDPLFTDLPAVLHSYAPAGTATALEFNDGKIFLAPRYVLKDDPAELIRKALAPKSAGELITEAGLTAFLNWGELSYSTSLWRAFYQELESNSRTDKTRYVFFDLCDFSRRTPEELSGVMKLIEQFGRYRTTVLSLNKNEAAMLHEQTAGHDGSGDMINVIGRLKDAYRIDEIIIHQHHESLLLCGDGLIQIPVDQIPSPAISTGAGDTFNAAYCFASLMKLEPEERLQFANDYAGVYVAGGKTVKLDSLRA